MHFAQPSTQHPKTNSDPGCLSAAEALGVAADHLDVLPSHGLNIQGDPCIRNLLPELHGQLRSPRNECRLPGPAGRIDAYRCGYANISALRRWGHIHRQHVVSRVQGQQATVDQLETDVAEMHVRIADESAEPMQPRHVLGGVAADQSLTNELFPGQTPVARSLTDEGCIQRQQRNETAPAQYVRSAVKPLYFKEYVFVAAQQLRAGSRKACLAQRGQHQMLTGEQIRPTCTQRIQRWQRELDQGSVATSSGNNGGRELELLATWR